MGDGFAEHDSEVEIDPGRFTVLFDACEPHSISGDSPIRGFLWEIRTETGEYRPVSFEPMCEGFSFPFREGQFEVRLTIEDGSARTTSHNETVTVEDWLIVSIGDSVASGEGNPDIPGLGVWQDRRCDRSGHAGPSQAALAIERADAHSSVTLVHLACSGGTIEAGLLGPYDGQNPALLPPLAPQVAEVRRLIGGREIDALLVSVGANDIRFEKLVRQCLVQRDCHEGGAGKLFAEQIDQLPDRYTDLARCLTPRDDAERARCREHTENRVEPLDLSPERVFITEYHDPMRGDNGDFCDDVLHGLIPGRADRFGVSKAEAQWASETVLVQLNSTLASLALRGWDVIGNIPVGFRQHGYCAGDSARWVVRLDESLISQGDWKGTLHPNGAGHRFYAERIIEDLRKAGIGP